MMARGKVETTTATMRSDDIKASLAATYVQPEWVINFEVANGTGHAVTRRADAIAMNVYPSRGLELRGMEIKVSRADFLSEMKNPDKADAIARYCNSFYLVCPKGLVDKDELPEAWGLIEVSHAGVVRIRKKAKFVEKPIEPVSKELMAAMLRCSGKADQALLAAAVKQETSKVREQERKRADNEIDAALVRHTHSMTDFAVKFEVLERLCNNQAINMLRNEQFLRAVLLVHKLGIASSYGLVKRLTAAVDNAIKGAAEIQSSLAEFSVDDGFELDALTIGVEEAKSGSRSDG